MAALYAIVSRDVMADELIRARHRIRCFALVTVLFFVLFGVVRLPSPCARGPTPTLMPGSSSWLVAHRTPRRLRHLRPTRHHLAQVCHHGMLRVLRKTRVLILLQLLCAGLHPNPGPSPPFVVGTAVEVLTSAPRSDGVPVWTPAVVTHALYKSGPNRGWYGVRVNGTPLLALPDFLRPLPSSAPQAMVVDAVPPSPAKRIRPEDQGGVEAWVGIPPRWLPYSVHPVDPDFLELRSADGPLLRLSREDFAARLHEGCSLRLVSPPEAAPYSVPLGSQVPPASPLPSAPASQTSDVALAQWCNGHPFAAGDCSELFDGNTWIQYKVYESAPESLVLVAADGQRLSLSPTEFVMLHCHQLRCPGCPGYQTPRAPSLSLARAQSPTRTQRSDLSRPGRPPLSSRLNCPLCQYVVPCNDHRARSRLAEHFNNRHREATLSAAELHILSRDCALTRCAHCLYVYSGSRRQHANACRLNQESTRLLALPLERECVAGDFVRPDPGVFTQTSLRCKRTLDKESEQTWKARVSCDVTLRYPRALPAERLSLQERLVCLPRTYLVDTPDAGHRNARKRAHDTNRRLADDACEITAPALETRPPSVLDPDTQAVHRAVFFTLHGAVGRAARALLKQLRLAPRTAATLSTLQALHPTEDQSLIPPLPSDVPRQHLSPNLVRFVVRHKMAKVSAPGLDGWTRELLLPLVDDPKCLPGLALLIEDLVNGAVSTWTREVLAASPLIALEKPDNGGLRPIAPESALIKVAGLCALELVRPALTASLFAHQYGVGRPGGTERAVHRVRYHLLLHRFGVTLDVKNAYNSVYRCAALHAVYANPALAPLWSLCNLLYSCPSRVCFFGDNGQVLGELWSARGVRQGCVLGPIVFSLAIDAVLQRAQHLAADLGVPEAITAYLDDITIAAPPAVAARLKVLIEADLLALGLILNSTKSFVLTGHDVSLVPADLSSLCVRTDFVKVLGSFVGWDDVGISQQCVAVAQKHDRFFELLRHSAMPYKVAFVLLRGSGIPRLNHLLRSTPPALTQAAAALFDSKVAQTMRHLFGDDLYDSVSTCQQLALPPRLGGLGVRVQTELHTIAYQCSCNPEGPAQMEVIGALDAAVAQALSDVEDRKIRLLSSQGPGAALLLTFVSPELRHHLSDDEFRAAVRFRLGLSPSEFVESRACACPEDGLPPWEHALVCPLLCSATKIARHDNVNGEVGDSFIEAGVFTDRNPRRYCLQGTGKHPDCVYSLRRVRAALDVSVTHPAGKKTRAVASRSRGAAARERARHKHAKFDEVCKANNLVFHAACVETYGLIDQEFLALLKGVHADGSRFSRLMDDWLVRTAAAITFAVHRGNYAIWRRYAGFRDDPHDASREVAEL